MQKTLFPTFIPVRSASKLLGVSMSRVYQLVEAGKLEACLLDGCRLISATSVDELLAIRERGVRRAA